MRTHRVYIYSLPAAALCASAHRWHSPLLYTYASSRPEKREKVCIYQYWQGRGALLPSVALGCRWIGAKPPRQFHNEDGFMWARERERERARGSNGIACMCMELPLRLFSTIYTLFARNFVVVVVAVVLDTSCRGKQPVYIYVDISVYVRMLKS